VSQVCERSMQLVGLRFLSRVDVCRLGEEKQDEPY